MASSQKRKGDRFERQIRDMAIGAGLKTRKTPLSGAVKDRVNEGDIIIEEFSFECKCRANGFREIYKWLGAHRGLFIRADRQKPLVVTEAESYLDMLAYWLGRENK